MRKPIWSALFLAILLVSGLVAGLRREGFLRHHPAPAHPGEPRVEVPRIEQERVFSFDDAEERMERQGHDAAWWKEHFPKIVRAGSGYYYLNGPYWYPARGFDRDHDTYIFYGPIAALGNLAPDEVIARVQTKLELAGYYSGPTHALLEEPTRMALARFQTEHHLNVSAAVDVSTLIALGLI